MKKIIIFLTLIFLNIISFTFSQQPTLDKELETQLKNVQQELNNTMKKTTEELKKVKKALDEKQAKQNKENLNKKDENKNQEEQPKNNKQSESSKTVPEISAVFNNFSVPENTVVSGELNSVFGSGEINGTVKGGANFVLSEVHLGKNAKIEGEINAVFSSITRHKDAKISDKKKFVFSSDIVGEKPANFGKRDFSKFKNFKNFENIAPIIEKNKKRMQMFSIFGEIILSLLIYILFSAFIENINGYLKKDLVKCGGFGLLGIILIIPIGILLVISIIGILLIPFYIIALILARLIAITVVNLYIGEKLCEAMKLEKKQLLSLVIGAIILNALRFLPLGGLLREIIILVGFGGVIVFVFRNKIYKEVPQPQNN